MFPFYQCNAFVINYSYNEHRPFGDPHGGLFVPCEIQLLELEVPKLTGDGKSLDELKKIR